LDSDQLFVQNVDHLFYSKWQTDRAGVCQSIKSHRGGANLMLIKPSGQVFDELMSSISRHGNSSLVSFHAPEQDLLHRVCPDPLRKESGPYFLDDTYGTPEFYCRRKGNKSGVERSKVLHFLGASKPWVLVPIEEFDLLCTAIGVGPACQQLVDKMVALRCYRPPGEEHSLEKVWQRGKKTPDETFMQAAYACCASFFSQWLQAFAKVLRYTSYVGGCAQT
jgi:hypothetical protein